MDFDKALQMLAVVLGAGGLITGIAGFRRSKAQNELDISTAWEKFSAPLLKRIQELEIKIEAQEHTISYLRQLVSDFRGWAERLAKQVIDFGGTPVPFIPRHDQINEYTIPTTKQE